MRHLAEAIGWRAIRIYDTPAAADWWVTTSHWVIVTGNSALAEALLVSGATEVAPDPRVAPWTDAYSNLFDVLKRRD